MLGIVDTEVMFLIKLLCIPFRSDCKKCRGFQPNVVHLIERNIVARTPSRIFEENYEYL